MTTAVANPIAKKAIAEKSNTSPRPPPTAPRPVKMAVGTRQTTHETKSVHQTANVLRNLAQAIICSAQCSARNDPAMTKIAMASSALKQHDRARYHSTGSSGLFIPQ